MDLLKNIFYTKINYKRFFIYMAISAIISSILFTNITVYYTNLCDFFIGESIYNNYNKVFDKSLPYIYTLITILLYLINFEYIFELLYKKLEKTIDFLLALKVSKLWVFISILTILVLKLTVFSPVAWHDNYHFGEILIGNVINEHSFRLYQDYFPPHGLIDVIPSWISANMLHDTTISGILFAKYILNYALVVITCLLIFSIMPFSLAVVSSMIITNLKEPLLYPAIYPLTLVFLLTNEKLKNNFYLFTFLVCELSYLLYIFSPTFGAPFVITLIIPFCYRFIKFVKSSNNFPKICLISAFILLNGLILFYFREFFINNFIFILNNFKANLLSYGSAGSFNVWNIVFKLSQYLLFPLFLVMLAGELKKSNKDINKIMLLIVAIIYPFVIIEYSLGRFDGLALPRTTTLSYVVLAVFLPLLIDKNSAKKVYNTYIIGLIVTGMIVLWGDIKTITRNFKFEIPTPQLTTFNNGRAAFAPEHLVKLNTINNVLNKYAPENYTFFDMTNQGALYYYLDKPPLIPYIAYYNVPSPAQDKLFAEKLEANLPDIVLIDGVNKDYKHDDIPASLRINKIYKTILLSGKYTVICDKNITFLKKVNSHKFTPEEIDLIENALGQNSIERLSEAYGKSFKHLKSNLEKLDLDYTISKVNDIYVIDFKHPVPGRELTHLYLKIKNLRDENIISVDGTETTFTGKREPCLIPLDIHPKVLLNNINQIKFKFKNIDTKIKEIEFYKR